MNFKDLKVGSSVYILESAGTFLKTNVYYVGTVSNIGAVYDDNSINNPYLSPALKKKLIDVTVSCNGISKKLTVNADKDIMCDTSIGLTVATNRQQLVNQVTSLYRDCEQKIASIEYYKAEADKCRRILEQLKSDEPITQDIEHDSIKVD